MKEVARLYPKSRDQAKKRDNHFDLVERIHEAEEANLKNPPEAAHKLVVTLEHDDCTDEKFAVYQNYQAVVHKESPDEITKSGFRRFLCDSPLRRETMVTSDGRKRRLGSYHQCYRLDGKLVAIGVLDLLPECVSSVYFLYHESIHQHAPGKLGALYEIALSIEEGYGWWYPGYYIHSCPKMWYKIDYSPQYVLDPVSLTWDPLDRTVLDLLDKKPYVSLSLEKEQASREIEQGSASPAKDTNESDKAEDEGSDSAASDEDDNNWLFATGMPGIPPISTVADWDMDHIALKISPRAPLYETSDLVSWDEQGVEEYPGMRAGVAELIAAIGPDLMDRVKDQPFLSTPNPASLLFRVASPFQAAKHTNFDTYFSASYYSLAYWEFACTIIIIMASQINLFSPAELAYLHQSLSLHPPIRPDGRTPTQFRPLTAETGVLPGTNGSARVHFADGTEAIVGVKAEIEKTGGSEEQQGEEDRTRGDWLELAVEIPGQRDDEASTIFLAEMLREALLADNEFAKKLRINRRFHWRLYLDVLLISPPLSYPLPLLSLTTHLALLATRLPRLKSEGDEDPMFDDDWEASTFLYPRDGADAAGSRPSITLLVVAIGDNTIFDPAKEELAVAETALAVSVAEVRRVASEGDMEVDKKSRELKLLSIRTIDPPSRLTPPGVPHTTNGTAQKGEAQTAEGVWKAPLGGTKFGVMDSIIQAVLEKGGVADEVLEGLEGVELT
ncbi:hypothetical protein LZL87_007269 [Fusarium oxysporum]|nr:hypothetical protein LZL87_007269 [Fusarium oxysporum]